MAVYLISGAQRSGKTLAMVDKIQTYLHQGRRVATNIDLNLEALCRRDNRWSNVIRIPDKPTLFDLEAIGLGAEEYDESKFGACILDECATWFNTRDYSDKTRKPLLGKLVQMGKARWDMFFLMQDVCMVDKQIRGEYSEYTGLCRRLDRQKFAGIKLPRMHQCEVYYKSNPTSPQETWMYRGGALYAAYDTEQIFREDYPHGPFCVLPPGYINKPIVKADRNRDFYMRLTKIYFRKYKRPTFMGLCAFLSAVISVGVYQYNVADDQALYEQLRNDYKLLSEATQDKEGGSEVDQGEISAETVSDIKILGYSKFPHQNPVYKFSVNGERVSNDELKDQGVVIKANGRCHARLDFDGVVKNAYC